MTIVNAVKTGNWSDPTVWSTGTVPVDGDIVSAMSYSIEFDVDINQPNTVLKATTGLFQFSGSGTRTITADANSGEFTGVTALVRCAGSGVGTLIFNGNGRGSNTAANTICFLNAVSAKTFIINGTVTGGLVFGAAGAAITSSGRMEVDVAIGGNASGATAFGASNSGVGTLVVGLAIGNNYGPGSPVSAYSAGVSGSNLVGQVTTVRQIQYGPYGASPTTGSVFLEPISTNTAQFRLTPNGTAKTLADPATFADSPIPADVRAGTEYNNGNNVGTCAVPLAGQTVVGVPVDDTVGTAVLTQEQLLATLQPNPGGVAERSIEDNKPLTFSWPNSTDTVTGEVSIDNGSYVAVAGAISYLREEHGKYYYTLAFNAADRPSEEGTARYKFTSGSYTMYATLRITVTNPATVGDWAVKRTFKYNGETVPGVRLLLVGISGKANTSGTDGIAQVNTNNGTFVLRTVVPIGFESIPDEIIIIEDADDISIVELTPMAIPPVGDELCVLQLYLRSQGTTEVVPLAGVNVAAKLVNGPVAIGPVLHLDIIDTAVTDSNGYAPLVLLRNTTYDLSITLTNSIHIKKIRITTSDASSAIISEVL